MRQVPNNIRANQAKASVCSRLRRIAGRCVRAIFERMTGWHVITILPRGLRLEADLAAAFPDRPIRIILDVGANLGQSVTEFLGAFPEAVIYSFEPVRESFDQLQARFAGQRRVKCFAVALSDNPGTESMVLAGGNDQFTFREHYKSAGPVEVRTEQINVDTVDEFCRNHSLEAVDFLKIDTEGHDLHVLRGARHMLSDQRICFVQCEVGMSPVNNLHVPFEIIKRYMEERAYYLFAIYEQVPEWPMASPILRRTNALFVASPPDCLHGLPSSPTDNRARRDKL